jgi:hypothetical protein
VAFHKSAQPLWVRIGKYILIVLFVIFFRETPYFWWVVISVLIFACCLHGFYRYKTKGWTQSHSRGFMRWDYGRMAPKE